MALAFIKFKSNRGDRYLSKNYINECLITELKVSEAKAYSSMTACSKGTWSRLVEGGDEKSKRDIQGGLP